MGGTWGSWDTDTKKKATVEGHHSGGEERVRGPGFECCFSLIRCVSGGRSGDLCKWFPHLSNGQITPRRIIAILDGKY